MILLPLLAVIVSLPSPPKIKLEPMPVVMLSAAPVEASLVLRVRRTPAESNLAYPLSPRITSPMSLTLITSPPALPKITLFPLLPVIVSMPPMDGLLVVTSRIMPVELKVALPLSPSTTDLPFPRVTMSFPKPARMTLLPFPPAVMESSPPMVALMVVMKVR